jgi:hypothetical protein
VKPANLGSRGRRGGIFVIVLLLCNSCLDPCGNDEVARVPSPDAKFEAVVFQRDCGATTGFTTQISILPKDASLPKSAGNLFVADSNRGAAPSAKWGGPPVDVKWSANRSLTIVTHPAARVFRKDSNIFVKVGTFSSEQVTVEYVSKEF